MHFILVDTVKLKPILQGHCWIFSGAIIHHSSPQTVGVVEIRTEGGDVIGYGFSDPESAIACRIFHFGTAPSGGFKLNYWKMKFQQAAQHRSDLFDPAKTNSYRLIHAEGDGLPGILVDVYGVNHAVLHTLIAATGQWAETWINILLEMGFTSIYHKHSHDKGGKWIGEKPKGPILMLENGISFWVDIENGQKTGFFLDQRDNRQWIGGLSKGKKVLNAFGFTGGFSIYALLGGASSVTSVDISAEASAMVKKNTELNQIEENRHQILTADCFDYLRTMETDFDLIILDPPAFAKKAQSIDQAARGYKDINLQAMKKIKSGGWLASFSCSQHMSRTLFQKVLAGAAADSGKFVQIIGEFGQPADHPVAVGHPEGHYLKGFLMRVSD